MIPSSNDGRATAEAIPWVPAVLEDLPPGGSATESVRDETPTPEQQLALEQAYARGRADGTAEGRAAERSALAALRVTLDALIEDMSERQREWLDTLDENLAALSVGIARQLLGREIEASRETVAHMVRRAVSQFPVGQQITVRVNPEDLAVLSATGEGGTVAPPDSRWIADPRIDRGGCIIEGPDRVIDGRLDRALERVYRSLTDE